MASNLLAMAVVQICVDHHVDVLSVSILDQTSQRQNPAPLNTIVQRLTFLFK